MSYTRNGVIAGATINLRVVFTDDTGTLVDPDALPAVYIYDATYTTDDIDAEHEAGTYTGLGPFTPTQISTGFYELAYTIPSSPEPGTWHDLWVATLDGVDSTDRFSFIVQEAANIAVQQLHNNELVMIELAPSIADDIGNTLGQLVQLYFSTRYSPLYASPDLVRLNVGPWIDYIPDDTLALMIHWSSKEVDFISRGTRSGTADFKMARTQFVMYDAAWKALNLPGGPAISGGSLGGAGTVKRLGDLFIDRTSGLDTSRVSEEILAFIREQRDSWWRVVNAGASIVPGQGFGPSFAVKGINDPDRRNMGRLWENPEHYAYPQPSVNQKVKREDKRRGRFTFLPYRRTFIRHTGDDGF